MEENNSVGYKINYATLIVELYLKIINFYLAEKAKERKEERTEKNRENQVLSCAFAILRSRGKFYTVSILL